MRPATLATPRGRPCFHGPCREAPCRRKCSGAHGYCYRHYDARLRKGHVQRRAKPEARPATPPPAPARPHYGRVEASAYAWASTGYSWEGA